MIDHSNGIDPETSADAAAWKQIVTRYQKPSAGRAIWQILNTLVPYAGLWCLMYFAVSVSWWLTVPLAVLAGAILVQTFIIFHDCGHGSFFRSTQANHMLGAVTGVLTFTPYYHWRWEHAIHHSSAGDLDRRGTGDVWTLTVQEYLESSRWKRFAYRLARNPFILFVVAPLFLFLIKQRVPSRKAPARERYSVYWTNLALGSMAAGLVAIFGLKAYLIIQLTALITAGAVGVWLFTCSTSSRESIGNEATSGTTPKRRSKAVHSINCRRCCSGFPAILDFITSIISAPELPITTWRNATGPSRCFSL